MASNKNNIRVGIDIGTSKVVCIIAENTSEGINVIGLGIQNSLGLISKPNMVAVLRDWQKILDLIIILQIQ